MKSAPGPRPRFRIEFAVTVVDLYFLYATTWLSMAAIVGGVLVASASLAPDAGPQRLEVAGTGLVIALFGIIVLPCLMMYQAGATGLIGKLIRLQIDEAGVHGWPLMRGAVIPWTELRSAGNEARMVVLRFGSPALGRRGWVGVPARSMSESQAIALTASVDARIRNWAIQRSAIGYALGLLFDHRLRSAVPARDIERATLRLCRWRRTGRVLLAISVILLLVVVNLPRAKAGGWNPAATETLSSVAFGLLAASGALWAYGTAHLSRARSAVMWCLLLVAGLFIAYGGVALVRLVVS